MKRNTTSNVITIQPKQKESICENMYQKNYNDCFKTRDLKKQMEIMQNLGNELGDISTIFLLPKDLMLEILGAAVMTTHTKQSAVTKWFYYNKLTDVYDYLATLEKEENDKIVNFSRQGDKNAKTN